MSSKYYNKLTILLICVQSCDRIHNMNITKEQNEQLMVQIEQEIEKRKLKWCQDTTEFVSGLLLGLEVGLNTSINQTDNDTNEEE